jgi:Uma2 family endonuclease
MPSVLKSNYLTHEEYFAIEQREDRRYEYIAGEIAAVPDSTESHALIGASLLAELFNGLRDKPCRVYGTNMKLYIREYDKFCYPDGQVLCEQGIRHSLYVENPVIIVEVLSSETEEYDRGKKFEHYRSIDAFKYYLLVDQTRKHVELYEKESKDRWIVNYPNDRLVFPGLDVALDLEEIYRQVEF